MSYALTLTLTAAESAAYDTKPRYEEWLAAREAVCERAGILACDAALDDPTLYRGRPFTVSIFHPDGRPAGWVGILVPADLGYRPRPTMPTD